MRRAGLLIAAAGVAAAGLALWRCGPPATPTGGGLVNWNAQPRRDYHFTVEGPLPWNETVYLFRTERGIWQKPAGQQLLYGDRDFEVTGVREKEAWSLRTENYQVSAAERRLLWYHEATAEFGALTELTVRLPGRAAIALTGNPKLERRDVITLADEATATYGCAIRDPKLGTLQRIWNDAEGAGHYYLKRQNAVRPFRFDDFTTGSFVIAAQTEGHQWIARRATLAPGGTLTLDTAGAPEGGGIVVCDEGTAVLLLGGERPIPYPRETEVVYRAVWKGVPPGRHAVLYPDGGRRDVDVVDGERVTLPKTSR